jgi:hypothetical protein
MRGALIVLGVVLAGCGCSRGACGTTKHEILVLANGEIIPSQPDEKPLPATTVPARTGSLRMRASDDLVFGVR